MSDRFKRLSPIHWLRPAPSMDLAMEGADVQEGMGMVSWRILRVCAVAMIVAVLSTLVAKGLVDLISLVTNFCFLHRTSTAFVAPGDAPNWGPWVIAVPAIGGVIVGLMARYGSAAIRGHGIPEAMEQILLNESKIPLRVTFLKPISSAIAIGTGGPFGAEGPIIATGGALGSVLGQWLKMTADERKTLLASGAAAGMTAIFGSPIAAVLLAFELLLFEFRPRSLIPVALAAATASASRIPFFGTHPVFKMLPMVELEPSSLIFFIMLGAVIGVASVYVTKFVYYVEDVFERLPIHWMWWPTIGGLIVGIIGYYSPKTMGVGYTNIDAVLSGPIVVWPLTIFVVLKFFSWSLSLGSGTSGGTLAPLFTIGGGLGAIAGVLANDYIPGMHVPPGVAALVGMAAIFAGASRALLTSVVFAFEATQQPLGLMPLLSGCSISYLISGFMMRNSIMTEKIVRRGVIVPTEYRADPLENLYARNFATKPVRTLKRNMPVKELLAGLLARKPEFRHQGFPVVDDKGGLVGVITRKDLLDVAADSELTVGALIKRAPLAVTESTSLRAIANIMVEEGVGRLPMLADDGKVIGIVTRSDLITAQRKKAAPVSEHSHAGH